MNNLKEMMKNKSGIKKDSYDPEQVKMGLECEAVHMIHGFTREQIMNIIHDHLDEDPEYYTHLEAMEEENEVEEPGEEETKAEQE